MTYSKKQPSGKSGLNPQQRQAAYTIDGPMLVLAGAGSGKTRVITEKIAYLIGECGISPSRIAALTFTNKSAQEMKSRVKKLLGGKAGRGLRVSTFHRLALSILQKEYAALDYKAGFSVFASADCITVLSELLKVTGERGLDAAESAHWQISQWKNDGLMPEQALLAAEDDRQHTIAQLYGKYQRQLHAYNAFDLDDLILQTAYLFKTHSDILQNWQNKIHYLLVDEYQDTNATQYELVKMLADKRQCLTAVGDDDQSIYAWRGAKPENLEQLAKDFPSLKVIKLEQNYRSTRRILKLANELIKNNPHVYEKKLWSDLGMGDEVRLIQCNSEEDEGERVCMELQSHKIQKLTRYKDYAILYRGNFQARVFETYLRGMHIPYVVSGGISFFERAEIKDIVAYLRLLVNPDDDAAFLRVINTPRRSIGAATLEKLGKYATQRDVSMLTACSEAGLETKISQSAYKNLSIFTNWLLRLAHRAEDEPATEIMQQLLDDVYYESWLRDQSKDIETAERRWKNVIELMNWLARLQKKNSDANVAELMAQLSLMDILQRNQDETELDAVQLMTLHAAKGLEFPHVFLVGFEEELIPHATSIQEDNIEEERRLAYVGITRAEKSLTMTMARTRKRYGEKILCEPSRFLDELPEDEIEWLGGKASKQKSTQSKAKSHLDGLKALLE
ncbi:MAG: UvrD-helicase domain-containing protein [Gammaproteobacteria bacterium]|nr:UvrD-helicase domain-containing protein [Gammaproteobacteria bacterium]